MPTPGTIAHALTDAGHGILCHEVRAHSVTRADSRATACQSASRLSAPVICTFEKRRPDARANFLLEPVHPESTTISGGDAERDGRASK